MLAAPSSARPDGCRSPWPTAFWRRSTWPTSTRPNHEPGRTRPISTSRQWWSAGRRRGGVTGRAGLLTAGALARDLARDLARGQRRHLAQVGVEAGSQLARPDRLAQEVVGAGVEAAADARLVGAPADEEDGHPGVAAADPAAELDARAAG